MIRRWLWTAGWCAVIAGATATRGAAETPKPLGPPAAVRDADALAAWIDQQFAVDWQANHVTPAPAADDAEFLRRVYLDLVGRIPMVSEAQQFLADKKPNKRRQLVEDLLGRPGYVNHFTSVWRSLLLPEADANVQGRALTPSFEAWLRKDLTKNAGYDQMVRELLTAPIGQGGPRGIAVNGLALNGDDSPSAFYFAKEFKPENIGGATARLFLGVKIECAQCHNHPFGDWKREQFWSYAAFFAGIQGQQRGNVVAGASEDMSKHELTIPTLNKTVQAAFLDGKKPDWSAQPNGREALADWMTASDNPYFARAAVNRMWYYFLGAGLTDPVDELAGGQGVASHPEILDELARQFIAHKYDLKYLMRAVTATRVYQLGSVRTDAGQEDPRRFARMPLRGMTPEQLFDSVAEAVYFPLEGRGNDLSPFVVVVGGNGSPREEFRTKFARGNDRPTETQTSILQALTLMNGKMVGDATSLENSELLAAVSDSPFMDTKERIETLYLATLTRKPTEKELTRLTAYVDGGGAHADEKPASGEAKQKRYREALADVFWALLNSGEFYLNH
ncbi:MAG TPA: DUF1549 domain-containing protein [Gemmataceae bacterium]|nr:DUF1549 domain-containing protein [Gemmataceae bacterium]